MRERRFRRNKSPSTTGLDQDFKRESFSSTTNKLNSMQINFTKLWRLPLSIITMLVLLLSVGTVQAQVSAYTFTAVNGTYTPITGGTLYHTGTTDDAITAALPIGFNFTYNGTTYTTIKANSNGWLSFGTTTSTGTYTPLSTTGTHHPCLSPLGRDLQGNGGGVRVETIGSSPNRVFVAQYSNFRRYAGAQNFNWQVRLYETTNRIEFQYDVMTANSTNDDYDVGITGNANTDFNIRTTTTSWTGTTAGGTNAANMRLSLSPLVVPASGLIFRWTPPALPACSGAPAPGATNSTVGTTTCAGVNFTLSLANQASLNSNDGYTYQWQSSPDGSTWTDIGGATGNTYTTNIATQTYYRCNVTCSFSATTTASGTINMTINPFYNCYAASTATSAADSELLRVNIGTLNNVTTCAQTGTVPPSVLNMYSQYTSLPAPTITRLANTVFTYEPGSCGGSYPKTTKVWIDLNQDGVYQDPAELVFTSPSGQASGTYTSDGGTIPFIVVPLSGTDGITGMRVVMQETSSTTFGPTGTYSWGETEDYRVNIVTPSGCLGTPAASNSTASSTTACAGSNVTLNTSVNYTDAGITFQWQSSAAVGGPYVNISGATTQAYAATVTADTYYRCVVTCTNGGAFINTTPIQVTINPFYQCYCVVGANNAGDTEMFRASISTLNNSSTCLTTGSAPLSVIERYSNYRHLAATPLVQTVPYTMEVDASYCDGTSYTMSTRVFIDYNQNGVFESSETVYQGPSIAGGYVGVHTFSFPVTVPLTALTGTTGMRVVVYEGTPSATDGCATYSWGETEDYLVSISTPPACSGTPAASSAVASVANACPATPINLSLSPAYVFSGLTFQWERSTDGGFTWNPIGGATNASATVTQSQATQYRCIIDCSGNATTSASVSVGQNALLTCYCANTATDSGDEDIFNVTFGTLNNSSTCATTGGAGSVLNMYSNYTGIAPPNIDKAVPQAFSARIGTCGGAYTTALAVFIDWNRNGAFDLPGERVFTPASVTSSTGAGTLVSGTITIPVGATDGLTLMRVIAVEFGTSTTMDPCANYTWGETEDYLINITTPPACTGTPAVPSMGTGPVQVIAGGSTTLSPTGYTAGFQITYQWQSGPAAGGPWTDIPAATNPSYTINPVVAGSTFYRMVTTCTASGFSSNSAALEVQGVGGASCASPYVVPSLPFQINFSTIGAGNNVGTQSCNTLYGGGEDVVFQFTPAVTGSYEMSIVNTSGTGYISGFLQASCGTGASLICAVSGSSNSEVGVATLTGGTTYYAVVDYWPAPSNSNFLFRIRQTPATPANNTAATALGLTHYASNVCGGATSASTAGATASGQALACTGGNADDDVWYSFVATADAVTIGIDPGNSGVANSGANIAVEFWSGTPGSLTNGLCLNASGTKGVAENGTIVGLVVGTTYYIRVYDYNALWGSNLGNFTLCLTTPPPPVNDNCAGAIDLTLNATCSNITGNTVSATQSQVAAACSGFTGNADDDVWYRVILAAPSNLNINVTATGTAMDPVVQLFEGTCGSLTPVFCNDNSIGGGTEIISRSLAAGTYYIRVYHYGVGTGAGGQHTICAYSTTLGTPPANDNIAGALTVPFVVDCSPQGPYTSINATRTYLATTQVGTPNDDVWFKFVATAGYANIAVQGGSGYDPVFQMFEMSSTKVITGIFPGVNTTGANGYEQVTYFGLTVGATYYIRVYDSSTSNPTGNFTICVYQTPPPANDICLGAETIFQQNSVTCGTPTAGFTLNATADAPAAPCAGVADDDVFYKFVATSPNPTITVTGTQGFDPVLNLRDGSGCPGVSIACSNTTGADGTETINATGLTVGATYRVRIYSAGSGSPFMGTFNVCVFGLAVPPANDNCVGAIALPNTSPCTAINGLVTGATQSQAGCAGTADDDVWYSFIAANTTATVTVTGGTGFDAVVQAFSGTCGSLTSLGCQDATFSGQAENLLLSGLTPGNTYYVRTYHYSGTTPSTPNFTICLTGVPPANDNIFGAINAPVRQDQLPSLTGTNLGATNNTFVSATGSGFSNFINDVWYQVTVPANGVVAANVESISIGDTRMRMWTSSDNTPTGVLTPIGSDDDGGPGTGSYMYVAGLTPGNIVYICVDGFSNTAFGDFRLNVSDGWVWDGQGGFAYNGAGNWINQGLGETSPAPGTSTIINIPIGNGVVNQPVVTVNTTVGGIYFKSGFLSNSQISVNSGITLTVNLDPANPGRSVRGVGSFGRFQGPGTVAFTGASAGAVNFGGSLGTIRFGGSNPVVVTVGNNISITTNNKLIFENGTSLYCGLPTYGDLTGNITYRRQGNQSPLAYNYWSSPVSGAALSSLSAQGFFANTYEYTTSNATGLDYAGTQAGWTPRASSDIMSPGRGYIATGAGLATFTGAPNQTDISYTPGAGGGGNTFNLVGNPFPAPISAATFLSQNAGRINGGIIYVWDDDASAGFDYAVGDYITTNGSITVNGPNSGNPFSGNIAAAQGFFVSWTAASGNIAFNQSQKVFGTNSQFFETNTDPAIRLRFNNADNIASETVVAFADDATDGYDATRDGARLAGNNVIGLYSFIDGNQYTFNYFAPLSTEKIIPLGALNSVEGEASITMNLFENFDASTVIFLEDMVNGVFHNLTANPTYSFSNGAVSSTTERFRLHFRAPIAVESTSDCSGMGLGKMIMNNPNNASIVAEVYNSSDVLVHTTEAFGAGTGNAQVVIDNLSADNYRVGLTYTDGTMSSKQVQVSDGGMPIAASFIASSNNVSIADAIVEFQGIAPGATNVSWNFGDGTEVTGDMNPVHAYMAPGVYTVTFTALNGGCGSEAISTVTVTANSTGLANVAGVNGFSIYPNPANEVANLLLNLDRKETQVTISIHDAAGRLMNSHNVNSVRAGSIVELDIDGLANGVYQVTVEGNNFKNVGRLTISK